MVFDGVPCHGKVMGIHWLSDLSVLQGCHRRSWKRSILSGDEDVASESEIEVKQSVRLAKWLLMVDMYVCATALEAAFQRCLSLRVTHKKYSSIKC